MILSVVKLIYFPKLTKKPYVLESYNNIRILNGLRVHCYYTHILSEEILSICNGYWFLNGIIWSRLRFTDFH